VLVLASRSPQRRAILEQLGIEFRVEVPEVEEVTAGGPREVVVENARRKARSVERRLAGEAGSRTCERVLGVDTAVVLDSRIFGKPADRAEAETFLGILSARSHEVHSGLCLRESGEERTGHAVTRVRFRDLDQADVAWYLSTGEWRGRAGAYAIQGKGAALVAEIEGDYWNVVGLPVPLLVSRDFVPLATHETWQGEPG
jgi:septum formation protein